MRLIIIPDWQRKLCAWLLALGAGVLALCAAGSAHANDADIPWSHGLSATGAALLPADFRHFAYARPDAPQGCTLRTSEFGTFDTLNPFVLKGRPALATHEYVYAGLLKADLDESLTGYGWLASGVRMGPQDRWVEFRMNPDARWHDGRPITVDDVLFTTGVLRDQGRPFYRQLLGGLKVEAIGSDVVRVHLPAQRPRQIAYTFGTLPILPRHWWQGRDFTRTTMEPPLGSGLYRVVSVDPGRRLTLERVRNHWSDGLAVTRGQGNFDRLDIIYLRDPTAQFESFLAGDIDLFVDRNPRHWSTAYDLPQVHDGRIKLISQRNWFAIGMNGIFFNLRSPMFADRRVREALTLLFDFEWANRVLFHEGFARTRSYFQNTELSADAPPDEREIAAFQPFRDELPTDALEKAYLPPTSDGSGRDRRNLERAFDLLTAAGWHMVDGQLRHRETGRAFEFKVLAQTQRQAQTINHWFKALERVGIRAGLQIVDSSVYNERIRQRRFDAVQRFTIPSNWPGAELKTAWRSDGGTANGDNLFGLRSALIDDLVDRIAATTTYDELRFYGRMLDRTLQWQYLAVPGHYEADRKIAMWDKFGQPRQPRFGYGLDYWWCRKS